MGSDARPELPKAAGQGPRTHAWTGTRALQMSRGAPEGTDAGRKSAVGEKGTGACQPQPLNGTRQLLVLLLLPPNPSAASAAWQSLEDENKERRGRKGRKKKKLMTHNCHDSGIGPGQLFYIPGMYSMQISTKGRHSFSIVDPEGNQISLWQPW